METPNYLAMYASAVETGRDQARRKAVQNALSRVGTDPSGAQDELLRYGAVNEAASVGKLAAQRRQQKLQQDIAPSLEKGDYVDARNQALSGGDYDLAKQLGDLNEDHLKQIETNNQKLGGIAYNLEQVPDMAERQRLWQQAAPLLIQQQVITPEIAQSVDLSDASLKSYQTQALTVQQQIDNAFKKRDQDLKEQDTTADNKRADAQLGETQRHNRTSEGIAGKNAATSAYSAETGRKAYDARKAAGGFGTPGASGAGWEEF